MGRLGSGFRLELVAVESDLGVVLGLVLVLQNGTR